MTATATIADRPQHLRALQRANEVRLARADLKRRVTSGQVTAVDVIRSAEGRELIARVLANARRLNRGLHEIGFDVVEPSPVTNADGSEELIITPIVPVRVGEDWKAGLLWRALWDAGIFTNVAVHPAVPPDGALLRTSVMATHDDDGNRGASAD